MNPRENQFVLLFPSHTNELDYTIWLLELDAVKNSNCSNWNIYYQNKQWNKTTRAHKQYNRTKLKLLQLLVPTATRGQTDERRFQWQIAIWNKPRPESIKCSAERRYEYGTVWTLKCACPYSATSTAV